MSKLSKLCAIILAAGVGKRIGITKWKLLANGETFLNQIIKKLNEIDIKNIICVARKNSIPTDPRVVLALNKNPNLGMFSSIFTGLKKSANYKGYMIFPVDHPFVKKATLLTLCNTFLYNQTKVVCPQYNNHSGHPIIIPEIIAKKITFNYYPGGLQKFLLENKAQTYKIDVNDIGILKNINTINDIPQGKIAKSLL